MAMQGTGRLSRMLREHAAMQWVRRTEKLRRTQRKPVPELVDEAAELHQTLARFLQLADSRMPRGGAEADLLDLPPGTDWHWRPLCLRGRLNPAAVAGPENARRLGDELAVYHDCDHRALILRQNRNRRATDLAAYGLSLEVMGFSGSYLSLSLDLPAEAGEGLAKHHVLRLDALLDAERDITVYGRLNIAQGPNTETVLRQLGDPISGRACRRVAEFDLGYVDLSLRPVDKVWLDLIFEAPYMNAVTLSDALMSRHTRAEM
ncbi:DUF6478 family protein [Paracoccus sp. Z330]|uniref:DUF6478 family protein n=1 Tax=Paracoccus onchidii TaxID=3017813 RepID=A0ABT4ZEH8_9RHOB|nr:DUF6478 family protein [Paracoccus onchidii]MDB6177776.1 DUF6478 family protein [Paracoccus onchidii]